MGGQPGSMGYDRLCGYVYLAGGGGHHPRGAPGNLRWVCLRRCVGQCFMYAGPIFWAVSLCLPWYASWVSLWRRSSSPEKLEKLHFLKHSPKRDYLFWLIFTVPGTPKDLLCYFAGLTDIRWGVWLLLCSVGRLPSVLTSTVGGSALGGRSYLFAALVFGGTLFLSLVGLLIYRCVCRRHEKNNYPEKKAED